MKYLLLASMLGTAMAFPIPGYEVVTGEACSAETRLTNEECKDVYDELVADGHTINGGYLTQISTAWNNWNNDGKGCLLQNYNPETFSIMKVIGNHGATGETGWHGSYPQLCKSADGGGGGGAPDPCDPAPTVAAEYIDAQCCDCQ